MPDEIIIREAPDNAYIYKATLKVMLEEDYLSQEAKINSLDPNYQPLTSNYNFSDPRLKELNQYSTQLIKETIIPKLTYQINTSKRYAPLRQVYYSLILAQWFKARYRSQSTENRGQIAEKANNYISLIDSGNLTNLTSSQHYDKQDYFKQYQKSFAEGEYNLQEPVYTPLGQSIRRYMSGGMRMDASSPIKVGKVVARIFPGWLNRLKFAVTPPSAVREVRVRDNLEGNKEEYLIKKYNYIPWEQLYSAKVMYRSEMMGLTPITTEKDLFLRVLPSLEQIFTPEELRIYWPDLLNLGERGVEKIGKTGVEGIFNGAFSSLKYLINSSEDLRRVCNEIAYLIQEIGTTDNGYDAEYLFANFFPYHKYLINSIEDLRKISNELIDLQIKHRGNFLAYMVSGLISGRFPVVEINKAVGKNGTIYIGCLTHLKRLYHFTESFGRNRQ